MKDEKRPWILREREASVSIQSTTNRSEIDVLPQTLVYISCGWESFKKVLQMIISSLITVALALDWSVYNKISKSASNTIVDI